MWGSHFLQNIPTKYQSYRGTSEEAIYYTKIEFDIKYLKHTSFQLKNNPYGLSIRYVGGI